MTDQKGELEPQNDDAVASVSSGQSAPPGWYKDPAGIAQHEAYWDGQNWTGATRQGPGDTRSRRWIWLIVAIAVVAVLGVAVVALIAVQLAGQEVTETFSEIGSDLDFDSIDPEGVADPSLLDDEELFVAYLREWSADQPYLTVVDQNDDATLIELGRSACSDLDGGADIDDIYNSIIAEIGADDEDTLNDMATIIGAGVGAFCPEHSDQLG
jgi:hypothetical protein